MRQILIQVFVLLLIASGTFAVNDAGRESPFAMGTGARALGLGSGFTALADDASLLYYNPAGLSFLKHQEISFMHTSLFAGTNYNFAGWVVPVGESSGTGLGFMRLGTDDIITRENFVAIDTLSFSHTQILFAYARKFGGRISLGGNLKVINQSFGSMSDFSYAGDLGLLVKITNSLSLGLIARDLIAPELELASYSEKNSRSYTFGMAIDHLRLSESLTLSLTADVEKLKDRNLLFHGGTEALFYDHYALRAGYDKNNIAVGAGLKVSKLRVDYSYKVMDIIESSHRFSLTWLIGAPKQPQPIVIDRIVEAKPKVLSESEQAALNSKQTAHDFFQDSKLDSALLYYQLSFEYDSTDQETSRMIAAIKTTFEEARNQSILDSLATQEPFSNRYFQQAYQFYDKKLYNAASDLLEIILEIDSGYTLASDLQIQIEYAKVNEIASLRTKANLAKSENRLLDEIEAYNRILEINPNIQIVIDAKSVAMAGLDLTQQLNLGIRLYAQERYDIARRRFNSVLKINPGEVVALDYLERIKNALAGPSSLEELQQHKDIWALYLKGLRHMRNEEFVEAISAWEKILEVFPNNSNTINNLEQARLRLKSEQGQ